MHQQVENRTKYIDNMEVTGRSLCLTNWDAPRRMCSVPSAAGCAGAGRLSRGSRRSGEPSAGWREELGGKDDLLGQPPLWHLLPSHPGLASSHRPALGRTVTRAPERAVKEGKQSGVLSWLGTHGRRLPESPWPRSSPCRRLPDGGWAGSQRLRRGAGTGAGQQPTKWDSLPGAEGSETASRGKTGSRRPPCPPSALTSSLCFLLGQ